MEIVTAPVPAQSPFIPTDAKIVVGAVAPASPDPIPIVLLPGLGPMDPHEPLAKGLHAHVGLAAFVNQVHLRVVAFERS
ncbi:MAG TPA: hypothetical protein VIT01_04200 [Acidimicrobiales bacterium]